MVQKAFAGPHTVKKLDCLERYLSAYCKVFKNLTWPHTIYIDAFAGTGEVPLAASYGELPLDPEGQAFIVGSARRALGVADGFHEYIFIEKKRGNARSLETLRSEFPKKSIEIMKTDANAGLQKLCAERDWSKCRAVVFLDPFGSQVEWRTIEAIAGTRAIDLWYLFPAGLSVHRQVRKKDGSVHEGHQQALDRILGTQDWRTAFAEKYDGEPDLFGATMPQSRKVVTSDSATRFMIDRMRPVFKGGVLNEWIPLGSGGHHMFSLLFAWANPSKGAQTAGNIALSVMRSGKDGRSK
jgi:three-Cys-motif partner protein